MHRIGDVGYVSSCEGLAADVDLAIVQREGVDKHFPEPKKLFCDVEFIDDFRSAIPSRTESCTRRLIDIHNVG